MPTYEYQCHSCGYYFEEFQSIHDKPIEACPKCGGKVKRLLSSGYGFIFKGSGFYVTDYKRKSEDSSKKKGDSDKKDKGSDKT